MSVDRQSLKSVWAIAVVVAAFAFPAQAASLVHRFDFEDQTGQDPVGGLEGVLVGDPEFSGDTPAGSQAIVLTGGQYVRVDDEMDFGSEFSIALWVRPDPDALGIQNLIGNAPGGWDTDGFKLYYNTWSDPPTADGAILLETGDGQNIGLAGDAVRSDTGLVSEDVWLHIGATVDAETPEVWFYLNGELLTTQGGLNVAMKTDSPFEIGRMINGWDLHGMMDDVQIYEGILTDEEMTWLFEHPGSAIGVGPGVPGDYNGDGAVDAADIDLQAAAMAAPAPDLAKYDENDDGAVTSADRLILVHDHAHTWVGDASLDGQFTSGDFVQVFTAGKYETGQPAGWAEGDWDGNLKFDSGDFVAAFTDGGYEAGARPAHAAVPEPSGLLLLALACGSLLVRRRRV